MNSEIIISDRAIISLAAHIAKNTAGVVSLADKAGRTGRGRVYITKDRDIEIYLICRYGADTAKIYKNITEKLNAVLGGIGNVRRININVTGASR